VSEAVAGLVLLLRHGTSDFGSDMSFDTSAFPGYVSGLVRKRSTSSGVKFLSFPAAAAIFFADLKREEEGMTFRGGHLSRANEISSQPVAKPGN
ncbi:hypothetical protein Tco_1295754, partial [Tanacetum coccineum]